MVIALLENLGFEGFDESGDTVKAYIGQEAFEENELAVLSQQFTFTYTVQVIAPQNWNAVWESHFEPVVIGDFVAVRAHFHPPITTVRHEIVITPKMSFGTGHHATTTLMIEQMQNLDVAGKSVLDFGTGTGILSIVAEKSGAAHIIAVDNDIWSIENSLENVEQNGCKNIHIRQGDNADVNGKFEVMLANINKNVILDNLPLLSSQLLPGGNLVLSGLLQEDEAGILAATSRFPLKHIHTRKREQWILLLFGS